MLYQDNFSDSASREQDFDSAESMSVAEQSDLNIQQELNILENTIVEGVTVPLTDLVVVDGKIVLERIDSIKENLPTALATSIQILQQRQLILQEANRQAQEILSIAQAKADSLLQESNLLRQTEQESSKLQFETEQECARLRQSTFAEIEQWREMASIEYEEIQKDADDYANGVLGDLETKLSQMLAIVQNGRQHIDTSDRQENSVM